MMCPRKYLPLFWVKNVTSIWFPFSAVTKLFMKAGKEQLK
jgi:hypothetical protein